MSNKTVVIILTIALGLTAYIFFFEKNTQSTSEKQARKNRVFTDFNRDRIDNLSIKHISGNEIVLEKVAALGEPDGLWKITKPKTLNAEQSEIASMLSGLDYLLRDRAVEGKEFLEDSKFGLKTPRIEGSFSVAGKKTTFKIGGDAEGDKVYFYTSQADDLVLAVSSDILTSLDKSLNDLREKKLIADSLMDAVKIELKRSDETIVLQKEETGEWKVLSGDNKILADASVISDLFSSVGTLRADNFIEDDVKEENLSKYGLKNPSMNIVFSFKDKDPITVDAGSPCGDNADLQYAKVSKSSSAVCIKKDSLASAQLPISRFFEMLPSNEDGEDIKSIKIAAGDKSLLIEQNDGKWLMNGTETEADHEQVTALLKALTETKAKKIDTEKAIVDVLQKPSGSVVLKNSDNKETVLEVFEKTDESVRIRRSGEPAVMHLSLELNPMLSADQLVFRERTMTKGDSEQVRRIEISGQSPQILEKIDGVWKISSPIKAEADMTAVRKLAELTSSVKAERFVSLSALKEQGFDRPFATVKTYFAKDDDTEAVSVLEIGAADAEGLRYARFSADDKTVFVLSDAYEYAIDRPLIARDLVQIDDTELSELTFKTGTESRVFKKAEDDNWKAESKSSFDVDTLKRIISDLSSMKATGAESTGKADTKFNASSFVVIAKYGSDESKTKTLSVGAKKDAESPTGYLAKVEGLDVTFVIPARIVEDILKFLETL